MKNANVAPITQTDAYAKNFKGYLNGRTDLKVDQLTKEVNVRVIYAFSGKKRQRTLRFKHVDITLDKRYSSDTILAVKARFHSVGWTIYADTNTFVVALE